MTVDYILVDLTDPQTDQDLYTECLRLRRDVFISAMGWNLTESSGCEFDQYDTPAAVHFAAVSEGRVIGCIRLMRTDNVQGNLTYMILDAHRGLIENLPSGLLEEEICSREVWEASRMAICQHVPTKDRNVILAGLVRASQTYVETKGGTAILGLMNPVFRVVFRRAKIAVQTIGPIKDQRDGPICVLRMDIEAKHENQSLKPISNMSQVA